MWAVYAVLLACAVVALYLRIARSLKRAKDGFALVDRLIKNPDGFHAEHPGLASFEALAPFGAAPTTTWLVSPGLIKKLYATPESVCGFDSIKRRMNHGVFGLPKQCMTDPTWDQLLSDVEKLFHEELAPLRLTESLPTFFRCAAAQLQDMQWTIGPRGKDIAVHERLYFMVTICLVQTFFGLDFPARDTAYYLSKFDSNMSTAFVPSALNFPFNILARRQLGSEGQDAFLWVAWQIEGWLKKKGTGDASELVQRAEQMLEQSGWTQSNIAKVLGMFMIALVANSSNAMSWMILVIAQSPALYAKIQEECDSIPSSDVNSYRLDLSPAVLSEKAPYLMSSLQEVLRLFSYIQAIRQVKEDCVLSSGTDHVQLRKGTRVVTSQRLVNVDTAVFGADALAFQGDRFIRNPKLQREFNTFGGGSSLCSGRHFAIPEIAGFVCLFFRGFSCDASGLVMMGVHDAPMKAQSMAIVDADETHIDGKWSGRLVDGKATGSGVMRPLCDNWLPIKPRGDILRFD